MGNYMWNPDDGYYLQHHGVKGQTWGVRNAEWYPIAAYEAHTAREKGKVLNKLDNSMTNDKYDLQKSYKKANKALSKMEKHKAGGEKPNEKKYNKASEQYEKHYKDFKKSSDNILAAQEEVDKLIKKWSEEGYDIKAKEVIKTAHKGEAAAKVALAAVEAIAMSEIFGIGIGTYDTNHVQGIKYKVKETEETKLLDAFEDLYSSGMHPEKIRDKYRGYYEDKFLNKAIEKLYENHKEEDVDNRLIPYKKEQGHESGNAGPKQEVEEYKKRYAEYKKEFSDKYSDKQLKDMAKSDAAETTKDYIQYLQDMGLSASEIHKKYGYSEEIIKKAIGAH